MADKVLKQFLILNFISSVLIVAAVFVYGVVVGFGLPLAIIFSGFVTSFFIKENKLLGYAKRAIVNSFLFSVLLTTAMNVFFCFTEENFWLGRDIFDLITGFIIIFSFLSFLNLAGALIGVIPKAIVERISSCHV